MLKKKWLTTLLLTSTACCSLGIYAQTTVLENINGYTINDDKLLKFHAIQFTDDKVDKIFLSNDTVTTHANVDLIDGKGKTLLPGLVDAHGHILSYGLSLLTADLVGVKSENDAVQKTLDYAKANPEQTWITGRGWNQEQWSKRQFPSAASLDKVFPDQPVWLRRVDGHAGWANSKAMELAKINSDSKSPTGGEIIKDTNGKPSGIFIDNAMALIEKAIPALTDAQQAIALEKAMKSLVSYGLTSVHDAGIDGSNLEIFKALAEENKMPLRVNAMLYLPSENWQAILQSGKFKTDDDMLSFNSVKIQADGALGSRGAALIDDYHDQAGNKGLLLHNNQQLKQYIEVPMKLGFQVNTHAIGDQANKLTLDLYQNAIQATDSQKLRHRIEHAQVLRLTDIPRFKALGVIASMQATHATSDKNMAQDRLGEDRIKGAYAWRKLLNEDVVIAAGSDFPVESPNPFYGLHASITRQDHQSLPKGGWFAQEKMTRLEALRSFTIDAAFAGHQEHIIGSLSPGKKADFILIDKDYFNVNEQEIWKINVLETWVNGKQVFKHH